MPVTFSGGIGGKLTFISRSSGHSSATSLRTISGAELLRGLPVQVSPIRTWLMAIAGMPSIEASIAAATVPE